MRRRELCTVSLPSLQSHESQGEGAQLLPSSRMSPRCVPTEERRVGGQVEDEDRRQEKRRQERKEEDWVFPLLVSREGKVLSKLVRETVRPQHEQQRKHLSLQLHFFGHFCSQLGIKLTLFSQAEHWGHLPQIGPGLCVPRHLERPRTQQSLFPFKRGFSLHWPALPTYSGSSSEPWAQCVSSWLPKRGWDTGGLLPLRPEQTTRGVFPKRSQRA